MLFDRFSAGVAHSFTGTAEDRDRLLSFNNLFIGDMIQHSFELLTLITSFGTRFICSFDGRSKTGMLKVKMSDIMQTLYTNEKETPLLEFYCFSLL